MTELETPTLHGPRADYLCEKCHERGKMAEPIELSVEAKHCPLCGKKKWLVRIWTPPHVMKSGFRPLNQKIDVAGAEVFEKKHEADRVRLEQAKLGLAVGPVPVSHVAGRFGLSATEVARPGGHQDPMWRQAGVKGGGTPTNVIADWRPQPSELRRAGA